MSKTAGVCAQNSVKKSSLENPWVWGIPSSIHEVFNHLISHLTSIFIICSHDFPFVFNDLFPWMIEKPSMSNSLLRLLKSQHPIHFQCFALNVFESHSRTIFPPEKKSITKID